VHSIITCILLPFLAIVAEIGRQIYVEY
jgi:hypothetical protein